MHEMTRPAQVSLLPFLAESGGAFELRLGERAFPIGKDEGREPVRRT